MDPIPYFYEPIDRNGILVRPKKPFYDWLNKICKDEHPLSVKEENNIYLIREMGSNEDINFNQGISCLPQAGSVVWRFGFT